MDAKQFQKEESERKYGRGDKWVTWLVWVIIGVPFVIFFGSSLVEYLKKFFK